MITAILKYACASGLFVKQIIMIFALLILIACAAQQQDSKAKELAEQLRQQTEQPETQAVETVQEAAEQVEEIKEETKQIETIEEPVETIAQAQEIIVEETVSQPQQRTKMYRFLDTFAQNVKSYEFDYKGNSYYIKGAKYKIILSSPVTVKEVTFGNVKKGLYYYDTIYMDRVSRAAMAYCEGHSSEVNRQCSQLELYDLAYPVQFDKYDIMLPEDWLLAYLNREPDVMDENKYYIEGRSTILVKFSGDPDVELNFDAGTGLVLRADQKKGNQIIARHDYEKLASNKVRDIDVVHRSKSEIPSEETFYR